MMLLVQFFISYQFIDKYNVDLYYLMFQHHEATGCEYNVNLENFIPG